MSKLKCDACGIHWEQHLGLKETCKRLDNARGALKVLYIWADFDTENLLVKEHVLKLCKRVLQETGEGPRD